MLWNCTRNRGVPISKLGCTCRRQYPGMSNPDLCPFRNMQRNFEPIINLLSSGFHIAVYSMNVFRQTPVARAAAAIQQKRMILPVQQRRRLRQQQALLMPQNNAKETKTRKYESFIRPREMAEQESMCHCFRLLCRNERQNASALLL